MLNVAWDHNTYYHERLLRALPAPCARVLDVGCGTGEFAARLSQRAGQVDALDRSPAMIAAARRTAPANVTCLLGDAATVALPADSYDAITSISALHHLDLPVVLPRLAAALRPGGLLIAVSHHRLDVPRGLPAEAVSVLGNYARRALLLCLPAGRRYRRDMYQRHAAPPAMPVMDPRLTLRQVRAQAAAALPGSRVRWLVHWRYELTWRKPSERGLPALAASGSRRSWAAHRAADRSGCPGGPAAWPSWPAPISTGATPSSRGRSPRSGRSPCWLARHLRGGRGAGRAARIFAARRGRRAGQPP